MSSNIKKIKLKEILEITSSKRIFMSEYLDSGIPFYRSKEIIEKSKGNSISTELFISEDRFNEIKMKFGVPVAGDILLTSVGTLGIPYLVQEQDEFYFKDGNLTWFRYFSNDINNKFMLCWLQSKNAKEQFDMITIGSTQKALTISSLKELEIPLPTLSIQKKIAHILSTLDDKIELNRKMNQTLEEMAQALFKSWFVDFDPVHAKANCSSDEELETAAKELGISKEILELFPSEFEKSELGMIPKGWSIEVLENICSDITRGVTPRYEEGSKRYIINQKVNKGKDLDLNSLKELQIDLFIPLSKMAHKFDILINSLGEGTIGRVHYYIAEDKKYAVDQHMSICRTRNVQESVYLYQSLQDTTINSRLMSEKTGSTNMTMLNISKIRSFKLLLPVIVVLEKYWNLTVNMYDEISNNTKEIQTLQKTRDTLLPKLFSGEIEV